VAQHPISLPISRSVALKQTTNHSFIALYDLRGVST